MPRPSPAVMALLLAALALPGCKSEPKEPPPETDTAPDPTSTTRALPGDASSAGDPTPADAGATLAPLDIPLAARCASPCLFLAEHRFAAMSGGAYCELCKEVKARACELEWPPIEDEPSCDDWDTWRRCLLAAHGFRFRSARARAEFRRKRWYTSRRGVKPSRLGPIARANHDYLKTRATACRASLAAKKGRVIARLSGDLDGDRRPERAVVTDTEVRVGRERLEHGLRPSDPMAAIEATLIDIDAGDRAVEILVALHRGERDASRYAVIYALDKPEPDRRKRRRKKRRSKRSKRSGPLALGPVIETFGAVEATGDGALEVREERCGQITTATYRYADGALSLAGSETEGQRTPARCD